MEANRYYEVDCQYGIGGTCSAVLEERDVAGEQAGRLISKVIRRPQKTKAAQQSVDPGSGTGGQRIPTAEEVRIEGNKARIREREKREKDERK